MDDRPEWITYPQAAEILGCHYSYVPKLVLKGLITPRRPGGRRTWSALNRAQIEELAEQRRQAAATPKPPRERPRVDHRPDPAVHGEHLWLSAADAARQIGVTPQAIRARVKRGRLPAVVNHGRIWIRADHFHQNEAAREATRTRRP